MTHTLALILFVASLAIAVGSFGAAWFLHRHSTLERKENDHAS